ncbi:hypothetical protein ACGFX2_30370 [Streptomyces goshikiensis]|uniref:hypothetical protein n=1 Tax=Streptomyces goshikiensis TaxID=1942 RepID=UPI003713F3E7
MKIRRGAGLGLIVLAGMCAVAAIAGRLYERPGGLAVVAELNSPWLLAALAALALAAGVALRSRRRPGADKAVAALVGAGILGTLVVPLRLMAADPFPARQYDVTAPGGAGEPRRLVVERTSPLVDAGWEVYVDQGPFPVARRWPVARCDDTDWSKGILQAEWLTRDTIRLIDLDHRSHDIPVAPDGHPLAGLDW